MNVWSEVRDMAIVVLILQYLIGLYYTTIIFVVLFIVLIVGYKANKIKEEESKKKVIKTTMELFNKMVEKDNSTKKGKVK